MARFIGAARVNLINLKCRIYYLHNIFPQKQIPFFPASWQSVLLCTDNQQERAARALFSSLRSFSLYSSSLYYAFFFPSRSHLFNLNPTPLMRYLLSSLSQSVVSLFLCERGPEHILISQLHISALPAAPSLVVQPWLSVCCSMSEYTANAHKKNVFPRTWMPPCAADM